ncbi:MAG: hypothetical protein DRO40_08290 [Thermoprotei archaeon]|nr:MAG: hypothetical protein DRO40_08290 [Thermoprotei archaeon]
MSRTIIVVVSMIMIISFLAATVNTPTTTPYSPFNTGDKGYSKLVDVLNAKLENNVMGLSIEEAIRYTIIMPLQKRPVDRDTIDYIGKLLYRGSAVIVFDEQGYSNELIKEIGLNIEVVNQTILDEIRRARNRFYPITRVYIANSSETVLLVFHMPSYIVVGENRSSYMIGYTSRYAYADLDGNGVYSPGDHMGQYTLVYGVKIGDGLLIIVSDMDIAVNELFEDNIVFLKKLGYGRELVLYTGYLDLGLLDRLKYGFLELNIIARYGSMEYLFIELMLILSILMMMSYSSKRELYDRRSSLISLVYIILYGIYVSLLMKNMILLIPLSILIIPYVSSKLRKFLPSMILSLGIFYVLSLWNALPLYIPLAFLLPFAFSEKPRIEGSLTMFIGPSSLLLIKHVVALLVLTLIDVRILVPIAIVLISCLILSILYFIILSYVKIEALSIPDKVPLGRSAHAEFMVVTEKPLYVVLERSDGFRKVFWRSIAGVVSIDVPADHVGIHIISISMGVFDKWGFSRRLLKTFTLKYVVVPITSRLIELIRKRIFSREEIRRLIAEVEVSLMEISSETGIPVGKGVTVSSREAIRVAIELLRRNRTGGLTAITGLLYRFLEVLEEQWSKGIGRVSGYVKHSRIGEYLGARDYIPGDRLRDIHWKKSLSKHSLIVKEYGVSGGVESFTSRSSVLEPIVILDLFATSNIELDHMMYNLLNIYLNIVRRNPVTRSYLVLIAREFILVVKGKSIDILYNLYRTLERSLPKILYSYESIGRYLEMEYVKEIIENGYKPRPLTMLVKVNKAFSNNIVNALIENTILPPKPYTLIHSKSLSFRYSILRYVLNRNGYQYIDHSKIGVIPGLQMSRGRIRIE